MEENGRGCRLVLAHRDTDYTARVSRQFRQLGWEVHSADSGPEARRLVRLLAPEAVVIGTDLPGESGWLTCAKLARQTPRAKLILVGERRTPINQRFTCFVGASALVTPDEGLTDVIFDSLPAAG